MTLMEMLSGVGTVLDTPGAFVRTGLAGENPFSGIFDPEQRVSGRSLLERLGVLDPNTEGLDTGDVGGFLLEMLLDPAMLIPGYGGYKLGQKLGSKFGKAAGMADEAIQAIPPAVPRDLAARAVEDDQIMKWLNQPPAAARLERDLANGPFGDTPQAFLRAYEPNAQQFAKEYSGDWSLGPLLDDVPVRPHQDPYSPANLASPMPSDALPVLDNNSYFKYWEMPGPSVSRNADAPLPWPEEFGNLYYTDGPNGPRIIDPGELSDVESLSGSPPTDNRISKLQGIEDEMKTLHDLALNANNYDQEIEWRKAMEGPGRQLDKYNPQWWIGQRPYQGPEYGVRRPITLNDILRGYNGHSLLMALLGGGALGGMAMQGGE